MDEKILKTPLKKVIIVKKQRINNLLTSFSKLNELWKFTSREIIIRCRIKKSCNKKINYFKFWETFNKLFLVFVVIQTYKKFIILTYQYIIADPGLSIPTPDNRRIIQIKWSGVTGKIKSLIIKNTFKQWIIDFFLNLFLLKK